MNARQPRSVNRPSLSDDDIVGWVTSRNPRTPDEKAIDDAEDILMRHAEALKEAIAKLTLGA